MDAKAHWEQVYRDKGPDQVSWFQAEARLSRALIERAAPDRKAAILDVGAGASTLVDGLLASGYQRLTVLDLSAAALALTRRRLGEASGRISLIEGDVLATPFAHAAFDLWHDRAVFHFLTDAGQRARYVAQVRHAVRAGGHVLVATFADDGPRRCSGLDVTRYSPEALHEAFGPPFELVSSVREDHVTPRGEHQAFVYCLCRVPG
jgi:SAM-dependent methyltransferase